MAFRISPNVSVTETDSTTTISSVTVGAAATVGHFSFGPVEEVTTIDSEEQLRTIFGRPSSTIYESYFDCFNYLTYANGLKIVRAVGTGAYNATDDSASGASPVVTVLLKNLDAWENSTQDQAIFIARYPGSYGNNLKVSVADASSYSAWTYKAHFTGAPESNEVHVVVVDEDGGITGTAGTILETYAYASTTAGHKNLDGSVDYYKTWINNASGYIYAGNDYGTAGDFSLAGGADTAPSDANLQTGYDLFSNPANVDISSIFTGGVSTTVAGYAIDTIAAGRKDIVVFVAPEKADVVNNSSAATDVAAFKSALTASSYYMMSDNWKYIYDKYNEVYRWISTSSDLAGLSARVDADNDPWFSFAGYNRGKLKNVVKLAWTPTPTEQDDLFKLGVNSIARQPGEGYILMGDKTGLLKPSAFGEIGVRKLFIVLEKSIANAAKYSLFEFNDEITQAQFVNMVEPFLEDVRGRRGLRDFSIVADSSINTQDVINRNEFRGRIRILPNRSIRYIILDFTAVNGSVDFDEVIQ